MAESLRSYKQLSKNTVRCHSADADEEFCQPCAADEKYVVAYGYCKNCEDYFCQNCIRYHKKQRLTKNHVILDKDKMPKGLGVNDSDERDDVMCDRHVTIVVKFYCTDHKVVGCSECMIHDHAECKISNSIKNISDISDDELKSEASVEAIYEKMDRLQDEYDKVENSLETDSKCVEDNNTSLVNTIRMFRRKMNSHLDDIEVYFLKEADRIKSESENTLKGMIAKTVTTSDDIKGTRRQLDTYVGQIKSAFVFAKQTELKLAKMEEDLDHIKNREKLSMHKFLPSSDLEKVLSDKLSSGSIADVKTVDLVPELKQSITVKASTDPEDCRPAGMAMVTPDKIAIGDGNNMTLKLVDIRLKEILSTCRTTSGPKSLAALSKTQIAVTFPKEKKLRIFDIRDNIKENKELRVAGKCMGIAHKDGKLALSYDNSGRIDIFDSNTYRKTHNILPKEKMDDYFKNPWYIAFGLDKDTLIVSDNDTSKVSVVTFQGEILRTFSDDSLRTPRSIVVSNDGTVIVASCANDCVHILAADFKTSKTILQEDQDVRYPECVCFDESKNTLLIWCSTLGDQPDLDNVIKLFELS